MSDPFTVNIFGAYEIQERIARGRYSVTYRALHTTDQRTVALKIFSPEIVDGENEGFGRRFETEVFAISRLSHYHITMIYDVGHVGDRPYIAMQYMAGGSLAERLKNKEPMSLDQGIPILQQIASALAFAHERGVIHRDVRPNNILFDESDDAYLSDFAVARLRQAITRVTGMRFTDEPAYRAPELLTDSPNISPQLDQYALAVVAFQMFTGTLPYLGQSASATAMMHLNAPIPSLRERNAALPPEIDPVFKKALAKSPSERFNAVDDFIRALARETRVEGSAVKQRDITKILPSLAAPPPPPLPAELPDKAPTTMILPPDKLELMRRQEAIDQDRKADTAREKGRPARPADRHRWYTYLVTVVLLVVAWSALGVILGYVARRQTNNLTLAAINNGQTQTAVAFIPFATETGQVRATATQEQVLALYTATALAGGSVSTPVPTDTPTPSPSPTATLVGGTAGRIAFVSEEDGDADIYILDLATDERLKVTDNDVPDLYPEWSPDGTMLAFASAQSGTGRHIYFADSAGQNITMLTSGIRVDGSPRWLGNEAIAFSSSEGGRYYIRQVTLAGEEQILFQFPAENDLLDISPRRDVFTFFGVTTGTQFEVLRLERGTPPQSRVAITQALGDIKWANYSPDRTQIVFTATASQPSPRIQIYLGDANCPVINAEDCFRRVSEDRSNYFSPRFSPDGSLLLVTSDQNGLVRNLFLIDLNGQIVQQVTDSFAPTYDGVWQPVPGLPVATATP